MFVIRRIDITPDVWWNCSVNIIVVIFLLRCGKNTHADTIFVCFICLRPIRRANRLPRTVWKTSFMFLNSILKSVQKNDELRDLLLFFYCLVKMCEFNVTKIHKYMRWKCGIKVWKFCEIKHALIRIKYTKKVIFRASQRHDMAIWITSTVIIVFIILFER